MSRNNSCSGVWTQGQKCPRPCPVLISNTTMLWCLFPIMGYELRMESPLGIF
ncbi:mCG1051125 [Mus musculus]|nr:mCG1051125 [Mus musculus]